MLDLDLSHPALEAYSKRFRELIALDFPARLRRLNEEASGIELRNAFERPLRFAPALPATKAADYEWAIGGNLGEIEGVVATRSEGEDAFHDLFNALIWLDFPQTKGCLNFLQVSEIARSRATLESTPIKEGGSSRLSLRSAQRDQITLLDENGVVFLCENPRLAKLLEAKDWGGFFLTHREALMADTRIQVFGHGLLQKCLHPFKSMTARVVILPLPLDTAGPVMDQALADYLRQAWPNWPKMPLPISGWPTWSPGQNAHFYADQKVFRYGIDRGSPHAPD